MRSRASPLMASRPIAALIATPATKTIFAFPPPLLKSCSGDLDSLRKAHARLLVAGGGSTEAARSQLLNSYSFFRLPDDALAVFESSPNPSVMLWNSAIRCLASNGHHSRAIAFYLDMRRRCVEPDRYTFTFSLKACTAAGDLEMGAQLREEVSRRGWENDAFIATGLVDMYSKLGVIGSARDVFDEMPERDSVAWNAMIAGYSQNREPCEALELFKGMLSVGVFPNFVTFLNLFPAISQLSSEILCSCLHGVVVRTCESASVFNGLMDTYSKCGFPEVAFRIFDGMGCSRDDVSWGTMISGFVYNSCFTEAFNLFESSKRVEGLKPSNVLILSSLSAAAELGDLEKGISVHDHLLEKGVNLDIATATTLTTMYAKCRDREKAELVFDSIPGKDVVAWSAMICTFSQMGYSEEALSCFRKMLAEGVFPNSFTISGVLPACSDLSFTRLGKSIHSYALKLNLDSNISVATALLAFYAHLRLFGSVQALFDSLHNKDLVAWNAIINGYAESGYTSDAISMFKKLQLGGQQFDRGTLVGLLLAFGLLSAIHEGASAHALVIKSGLEANLHVKNATIDMYAKCGDLFSADLLFNTTESKGDVISWNTLIAGYMHCGRVQEAISTFNLMRSENVKPNSVTLVSIIPANAFMASLRKGLAIHSYVISTGFEYYVVVGNSLIDMYSKCGSLSDARKIFNQMVVKDTVSWNVLLFGYSIHGLADLAVTLFYQMDGNLVEMDSVSFINVLSACRHGGFLAEGRNIFSLMLSDPYLKPNLEHYACMVDLLSRKGCLDEAWHLIGRMAMAPDAAVWGALLGGCRTHSNLRLGEVAFDHLLRLEPQNPVHYIVLSSIYEKAGRWAEARSLRTAIRTKGVGKTPGCSWVELKNTIHAFRAGDRCHPQYETMKNLWNRLQDKMEKMGYVPDTSLVLHNVEEEEKESFLYNHSERLAMAFALANTEEGSTILIVKNLRVCGDCHAVTKMVSEITGRTIVMRDSGRFHHFVNGACSCNEFW